MQSTWVFLRKTVLRTCPCSYILPLGQT